MESLRFISGPMQGQVADLAAGDISLGRDLGNLVSLEGDPGVSRQHARIYRDGPMLHVADAGSANGTLVNGLRIGAPTPLRSGDVIQIASHVMRVEGGASTDPTHVFAQSPLAAFPEPPLPAPMMNLPMGHPAAPPQGFPPPGYGHPHQAPPAPNVVVTQQVIVPDRSNGVSWVMGVIALMILLTCGLGETGAGRIVAPGVILLGGAVLALIGWMDYRRFSPYREWYEQTRTAMIKLVLGAGLVLLGSVWLGYNVFGPHGQPEASERRN